MELPIEHSADSVATLRGLHDRSQRERRHLPRFAVWAPATVRIVAGPAGTESLEVNLTDLACGGIGFLSPRRLQPGQRLHVSLPATEAPTLHALCEVVHCSTPSGGASIVGARFAATFAADPTAAAPSADAPPRS